MREMQRAISQDATAPTSPSGSAYPLSPQSIPPWVHANNESHETSSFLRPAPTRPNTRHYKPPSPALSRPPKHYKLGRKWDSHRDAEPALLSAPIVEQQLRWAPFMRSGPNPHETLGQGRVVSREWLEQNLPIATRGWQESDEADPEAAAKLPGGFRGLMYRGTWLISPERQERTVKLFWRLLLKNAFVPLAFRLTVLALAIAALGVGVTLYERVRQVNNDSDPYNQCDPRASTYMAIAVGAVTVPYLGYVTWDEYMSKPLGLRSVAAKTLLLLCDLWFIVFSASNVSLAIDALLDDSWACYDQRFEQIGNTQVAVAQTCPNNLGICFKQKALSGLLIVLLISWMLCFGVSVMRVMEKLRPD